MATRIENETVINFNEEEETVSIYTASDTVKHRCQKLGFALVKTDHLAKGGEECGWWFECPKSVFRFGRKKTFTTHRILTEAHKQAMQAGRKNNKPNPL